jgi:uncharacterized membrane protein YphA (DoxX/SURF4 family)
MHPYWIHSDFSDHRALDHIARLTKFKAPFPKATFWIGQTMEFVGCAMVLFNWHADMGVILLIVFTVLASLLLLRFWEVDVPPMRIGMQNGMVANIAVVGACCCFCSTSARQGARLDALGIAQAIRGPDSEVDRGSSGSSCMWSAVRAGDFLFNGAHRALSYRAMEPGKPVLG